MKVEVRSLGENRDLGARDRTRLAVEPGSLSTLGNIPEKAHITFTAFCDGICIPFECNPCSETCLD